MQFTTNLQSHLTQEINRSNKQLNGSTMKQTLLVTAFAIFSLATFAQHAYITENQKISIGYNAFVFELNSQILAEKLASAPIENSASKSTQTLIQLPLPNGNLVDLEVEESPIMAPELAAKYPQIKTYKVKGQEISGRISMTEKGFNGMLFTNEGTIYIDPIDGNPSMYQAYNRKDYTAFYKYSKNHECLVDGTIKAPEYIEIPAEYQGNTDRSGDKMRTYRLALACTGEYAQYHGGTTSGVLSAMVVSMNRVNGVYEREFAITMVLIANNDQLIFFNSSTDPYTNNNGGTMLSQNQSTINSIIGSANYDIGHVFSTGGGGIASLGSVCSGSSKAMGVTGSNAPVGDPFDIDYVAHEMGHQFGGNHTQNNQCNRASTAAFEPGSASTIMGYAGICPPNLQNNSDDYFHSGNFDEVVAFAYNGNGNSCAVKTNTSNSQPVVTVPTGGFYIPHSTPFVLRGSATDPNGDNLTYCWEEMDLGPSTHPDSPTGTAPAFRSWDPLTIGERTCPRLQNVVLGNTVIGETYINYSRSMKFRMTVRDNNLAGGGVAYKNIQFNVDGTKGPFLVTTPAQSAQVEAGTYYNVTWDVAQTNLTPINCQSVNIMLCTNNGLIISDTLALGVPNTGSYTVMIPNVTGTNRRVRVEAADNIFFNLNPGGFQIVPQTVPDNFGITLTADANYATGYIELNWTDSFNNELGWVIERQVNSSGTWDVIDSVGVNTTFYEDTNVTMYGTAYLYRVYAYNNAGNSAYSNEDGYLGVGINELSSVQNFKIFPNPATTELNIRSVASSEIESIEIRDTKGAVIMSSLSAEKLNIAGLSSGNYFIIIKSTLGQEIQPFSVVDKP